VGGGNTFKLLRDFRKSGFDKLLLKFHKAGGHIYGGSAGAIILGKTIATAKHADKNEVELTNLKGLNLAKNFAVWCHYQVKDRHNLEILSKDERISILALEESAGAIVQNDLIIPVGPGTVLQFDGTVSEPLNKAISVK
jgi:dipeptidase E